MKRKTIPLGYKDASFPDLQFSVDPWLDEARCSPRGSPTRFLGRIIKNAAGEFIVSEDEFYRLIDRSFHASHDARWASGDETSGLVLAVNECLRCPAQRECLAYAMEDEASIDNSIYGGTTRWERQTILSRDGGWLKGLDREERLMVLQRLVDAKKVGYAPPSVGIDHLRRKLAELKDGELNEEWTEALEASSKDEEVA